MTHPVPYISTENLVVGYRRRTAEDRLLQNLNLELWPREMICFMGPNGAGKSSLLRTLAGLQAPLAGNILFHTSKEKDRERQVSVVLTDRISAGHLTVEDIITFGRYPYLGWGVRLQERDKRMIADAVAQVGIGALLNRQVYELSDGQMQMVMIARAIAQDTPVILLDEPTAHLDLNNRVEIMNLLRKLSRSGKAVLLATHELDLALQTADRIWLTGRNADILTGLPEDLILNGTFDEIFKLKGFDLKSGKVLHGSFRGIRINLSGDGAGYLWTKNALERNGFEVSRDPAAEIFVNVIQQSGAIRWRIKKVNTEAEEVNSVESLLKKL